MELRDYQQKAIEGVRESIRRQAAAGAAPSVLLTSPTGSGKTATATFMIRQHIEKGGVAYFLCHRRELIEQTSATFDRVGLRHSMIASGYNYTRSLPIQICSVGTLTRRVKDVKAPTLAIWDECHHVGARTWANIREAWTKTVHIGLTATPERLDGKGLGQWFSDLVLGPSVAELIERGYLSKYEIYAPVKPQSFHVRAGDFIKAEMESALGTGEILGGIVDQWQLRAAGKKTIMFAISVDHSQALVEKFRERGIKAAHLDAQSSPWERKAILQSFARGDVKVLSNVDLFGEGFDLAANSGMDVTVESVICARPTASLGLHLQQVGRALRPKAEPAIILDHAGNTLRHGFPDDDRDWTLDGSEDKLPAAPTVKTCPKCFFLVKPHIMQCPSCGFVWIKAEGRKVAEVEGELTKLERGSVAVQKKRSEDEAIERHRDGLRKIAIIRGLSEEWVSSTFSAWLARRAEQSRQAG